MLKTLLLPFRRISYAFLLRPPLQSSLKLPKDSGVSWILRDWVCKWKAEWELKSNLATKGHSICLCLSCCKLFPRIRWTFVHCCGLVLLAQILDLLHLNYSPFSALSHARLLLLKWTIHVRGVGWGWACSLSCLFC